MKTKLLALLGAASYRHMCNHEFSRPRNTNLMSDVYDSPAWRKLMGPCVFPNNRLGLLFCIDGIPAFASNTLSLKPAEFMNLSLPPGLRAKAENLLLLMLMPANLKHKEQKKYYDFAAHYELCDLASVGIAGVKVKVFASSLDTPGRAEVLGMQSVSGYQSCCVCTHCWSPGLIERACQYGGYRRFLVPGSRGRQSRVSQDGHIYEYGNVCTRSPPKYRNDDMVRTACALACERGRPTLGHKSVPLQSHWPDFSWYRQNVPDLMHGIQPDDISLAVAT